MRAVVCTEFGPLDRLVVEEREPPTAGAGQVVVAVPRGGVNYVDGLICEGRYQMKPAIPFVPGSEIAGEITAVGPDVDGLSVGDRVLAVHRVRGFAEQVALPVTSVIPMPPSLDFGQAATLVQSYSTVLFALTRRTTVVPGEWVLVLGAGGGIGLAAVDVARALGARVIAAASSDARLDAAREMGAEAVIAYESEDLKTRARELSGDGVDVVIDPVGGRHSEAALRATRLFGRFCVIGFAAGIDRVDPAQSGPPPESDPDRRRVGRLGDPRSGRQPRSLRRSTGDDRGRTPPPDAAGELRARPRRLRCWPVSSDGASTARPCSYPDRGGSADPLRQGDAGLAVGLTQLGCRLLDDRRRRPVGQERSVLGHRSSRIVVLEEQQTSEIEARGVVTGLEGHRALELGVRVGEQRAARAGAADPVFDPTELPRRDLVVRIAGKDRLVEVCGWAELTLVDVGRRLVERPRLLLAAR